MKHSLHLIAEDLRCEWAPPPRIDLRERWIGDMVDRFDSDVRIYHMTMSDGEDSPCSR